jgi:hypothetical protein
MITNDTSLMPLSQQPVITLVLNFVEIRPKIYWIGQNNKAKKYVLVSLKLAGWLTTKGD